MKSQEPSRVGQNLIAVTLAECVLYTGAWLWNDYVAMYATLILSGVMLVILILSLIADWIEPSRIPKWYYGIMLISIVVPLLIGAFFVYVNDGRFEWMIR